MATAAELAQRRADVQAIEDDTMTWAGADYSGVFTTLDAGDTPEVGGFARDYGASFHIRAALFASTLPSSDQEVTVNGTALKVLKVVKDPDGVMLELQLGPLHGG